MRCLRAAEPIPAEHRRAGPEQRPRDAGDVEVFVAETGEHGTRDETGDQRAEDTDEDVGACECSFRATAETPSSSGPCAARGSPAVEPSIKMKSHILQFEGMAMADRVARAGRALTSRTGAICERSR